MNPPNFTKADLLSIFSAAFGYPANSDEIAEIFPSPGEHHLPDTLDTIVNLANDSTNDFTPTVAWYEEQSAATCPLAVFEATKPNAKVTVVEEVETYAARLTLMKVDTSHLDLQVNDGPWTILLINVGRGAPYSYIA